MFRIYLIDHAWTYRTDKARDQLEEVPHLLQRMAALMEIECHGDKEDMIEAVLDGMWK